MRGALTLAAGICFALAFLALVNLAAWMACKADRTARAEARALADARALAVKHGLRWVNDDGSVTGDERSSDAPA